MLISTFKSEQVGNEYRCCYEIDWKQSTPDWKFGPFEMYEVGDEYRSQVERHGFAVVGLADWPCKLSVWAAYKDWRLPFLKVGYVVADKATLLYWWFIGAVLYRRLHLITKTPGERYSWRRHFKPLRWLRLNAQT